jgi:hypothetical protein
MKPVTALTPQTDADLHGPFNLHIPVRTTPPPTRRARRMLGLRGGVLLSELRQGDQSPGPYLAAAVRHDTPGRLDIEADFGAAMLENTDGQQRPLLHSGLTLALGLLQDRPRMDLTVGGGAAWRESPSRNTDGDLDAYISLGLSVGLTETLELNAAWWHLPNAEDIEALMQFSAGYRF